MKLTILLVTIALTAGYYSAVVSGQEPTCGTTGPAAVGYCYTTYGYAYCVTNVITALRDVTPSQEDYSYSISYPPGGGYGAVQGAAKCHTTVLKDCQQCLVDAKNWLDQYCTSYYAAAYYSSHLCDMTYYQIV